MKSVLVIGSNGMLGYAVSEYFKRRNCHVECITRKQFDIAGDSIEKLNPIAKTVDFAVNCAGIINKRISEFAVEDILKVNSVFPQNLAKLFDRHRKACFHITTDCVFSGNRGLYTESDYFDAEDVYGLSKCGGDMAECMVLRTSIIGEEKNNSRSLLEWTRSQSGNMVNGYINHLWNGVTTIYLAEIIDNIQELNLYESGIFHIFSDPVVSKFELLCMINEVYDLQLTINRFETSRSCDRSLTSEKDLCKKVVKKSLKIQIEEMKRFFEHL